jgi:signal transduction histidine kinase
VADNGVGLDSALLPHVFDLFTQGERASDRAQGGLGIGLALVRNIVTMHGGTVSAHSNGAGTGSTFTVTLDLADPIHPHGEGCAQ